MEELFLSVTEYVYGVRQIDIHTPEPLAPGLSSFEFESAIEKLKNYKSPGMIKFWQN
jgi:hypothetical protein